MPAPKTIAPCLSAFLQSLDDIPAMIMKVEQTAASGISPAFMKKNHAPSMPPLLPPFLLLLHRPSNSLLVKSFVYFRIIFDRHLLLKFAPPSYVEINLPLLLHNFSSSNNKKVFALFKIRAADKFR